MYNGAVNEHQQLCVKVEAGRNFCYGTAGSGSCPGDMIDCTASQMDVRDSDPLCYDKKKSRKCLKKKIRGKCMRYRFAVNKCRKTCGKC